MARYNFALTNDYGCVCYMESTPEEDKLDIGIGALDGYGYLKFWKRCREATDNSGFFGKATILDTSYDEEKTWELAAPRGRYSIKFSPKDIWDALNEGVGPEVVNDIAIHLNMKFHEHLKEWAIQRYEEKWQQNDNEC